MDSLFSVIPVLSGIFLEEGSPTRFTCGNDSMSTM